MTWLAWASQLHAELVVVVNEQNPISSLSSRQLIDLYMGRYDSYPNGVIANTVDWPERSQEREMFYRQLVNKSTAQVNAYWARLLFTGKSEPPLTVASAGDIINFVKKNINAIAYLNETDLVDGLKVVYRFENTQ
ncbi:hypothetical protein AL542_16685 [Grimontia hollisae]|nr:hypothetical protein [Grimontia hollisae]AMG32223.2 hypothetical protein AL542_16685 [Grimontia hollisae]MDF2186244.1 hypothetical protein [Grimontia hollisae]STO44708.1 Uncharacterised protein [Grimontia hollisae]STO57521.1 Uncharacterised protein [Grimontia hollisae]STQ75349.1 Uncharacterised protein [Grimontia hollisae]